MKFMKRLDTYPMKVGSEYSPFSIVNITDRSLGKIL